MTPSVKEAKAAAQLPALRQDLQVQEAPSDLLGCRRWVIFDALQSRYFSIGQKSYVMLQLWARTRSPEAIVVAGWNEFAEQITLEDVEHFEGFLRIGNLVDLAKRDTSHTESVAGHGTFRAVGMRLLHNYLFYRVPLLRPERFLAATIESVRPFGTKAFGLLTIATGSAGAYLVSREWETFATTISSAMSLEGAAMMAAAMFVVKILHELGHAYTAHNFGCRVPTIGVAFVLGFPMLYCDVTDAWRLKSRRHRLIVDGAGIAVDLSVACFATFLWAFLPPGFARDLAFSLATAGWVMSVIMNLNPFMRFDGYHLAVDALGIDNLQERASELARWKLREIAFELNATPPEKQGWVLSAAMIGYGWALWLYRLVLFTGIALAVYAFFFKLLGVILFLVEIGYFLMAPLWREMRCWSAMRNQIVRSRRTYVSIAIVVSLLAGAIIPWSTNVYVPAVLEAARIHEHHALVPAIVREVSVVPRQQVEAGDVLVRLAAPSVSQELAIVSLKLELNALRRSRRVSDAADREDSVVLEQEHKALLQRRSGLLQQRTDLDLRAGFSGEVAEVSQALHAGRWISSREPILSIKDRRRLVVRGYIEAADVWRVDVGAHARFVPDGAMAAAIEAKVASVASVVTSRLDQIELAQPFGGRIAARLDATKNAIPVSSHYALRADALGDAPNSNGVTTVTGVLVIRGQRESIAARTWRQILKVLVRESGA